MVPAHELAMWPKGPDGVYLWVLASGVPSCRGKAPGELPGLGFRWSRSDPQGVMVAPMVDDAEERRLRDAYVGPRVHRVSLVVEDGELQRFAEPEAPAGLLDRGLTWTASYLLGGRVDLLGVVRAEGTDLHVLHLEHRVPAPALGLRALTLADGSAALELVELVTIRAANYAALLVAFREVEPLLRLCGPRPAPLRVDQGVVDVLDDLRSDLGDLREVMVELPRRLRAAR